MMHILLGKAIGQNKPERSRWIRPFKGNCFLIVVVIILCLFTDPYINFKNIGWIYLLKEKEPFTIKKANHPCADCDPYNLFLPLWAQGFIMPIMGANLPRNQNLLPGAPRGYRNGVHEGIDFFCPYNTPVLAAKDGNVIFSGSDYEEVPLEYRERLLQISNQLFKTPGEILNLLHGRHVILDHGMFNGRWVITVYSHLSKIDERLKIGDFVRQGSVIGYTGNSGTSFEGTDDKAHLHFEIRINGHYVGEGLLPQEIRLLLKMILERSKYAKSNQKYE